MATRWYAAHSITPADEFSIQKLPNPGDYTDLSTGDMCILYLGGFGSLYRYDETDSTTEEIPARITPTGNSGNGRWVRKRMSQVSTFFNGTLAETFNALVTSDGATVTLALAKVGGGDLTAVIPEDVRILPAQNIALTPGSDASPTANYVYVLASAPTVLAKSTSDWPSANHIKIAYCLVPSATYVASHGCYINQNWNDGTADTGIGQLAHMGENIRLTLSGASWHSGVAGNGLTDDYITIVPADTPDSAYFLSTAGLCYQMHRHTVPAFDSETEEMLCVNSNAGAYTPRSDIRDEEVDAAGGSLTNKYYNVVFWMVANKTGEYAPCMMNMPSGSYTGVNNAINDVDGHDVYDMPRQFNRDSATGFLICRVTFRQTGSGIVVHNTTDLRGRTPGSASGSISGTSTEFADNQFKIYSVGDVTKIVDLDLTGITNGNTRTITPADADMTLLSTTDYTDLTDGGDTTLHDHDGISENTAARHADSHTVVSHSDTTATGAELNTLTDGSETALHYHSSLADNGETGVVYTNGGAVELNYNGTKAAETFYDVSDSFGILLGTDGGTSFFTALNTVAGYGYLRVYDVPFYIDSHNNGVAANDLYLRTAGADGALDNMVVLIGGGAVELYSNGNLAVKTYADGTNTGLTIHSRDETKVGYYVVNDATGNVTVYNETEAAEVIISGQGTGPAWKKMANFDPDGSVDLYWAGGSRLSTSFTGATLTGTLVCDGVTMGSNEFINFGGVTSIRTDGTSFTILNDALSETLAKFTPNGSVILYYNNVNTFETTPTGAVLAGGLVANALTLGDYESITFGADADSAIAWDGGVTRWTTVAGALALKYWNGSGLENMVVATPNGATTLYYNNNAGLATKTDGVYVHSSSQGTIYPLVLRNSGAYSVANYSGIVMQMATSTSGSQNTMMLLSRFVDVTHATRTSSIILQGLRSGTVENIWYYNGSMFALYYNGTQAMQTAANGINVHDPDGVSPIIIWKSTASADHGRIQANATAMYIRAAVANNDSDIQLQTYNGSGWENMLIGYGGSYVGLFHHNVLAMYTTSSPGIYVQGTCSALVFTDRTPAYEGDSALEEIKKIKNKDGKIDHSTLPSFARKTIIKEDKDGKGNPVEEEGRDLGAMISILVKAVQELSSEIEDIKLKQNK